MKTLLNAIQRFPLLFLTALALIPRLYNLHAPVIGVHSWRQADTAAIARNFTEAPFSLGSFLYPQVDWGGGGYAETEFPLYPALVSFLYRLFGVQEAYARGLSVVFSAIGLYFLYRLVNLFFNQSVAFWSAFLYAILPLSVFYGRTVQPESLVVMSSLGGLYFFKRGLSTEKRVDLFASWVFVAIAILLKVLPIVYLGLPLLFLATLKYKTKLFLRLDLWIYALSLLGVTVLWYTHAHQIYLDTGLTFGFFSGDTDRYEWAKLLSFQYWLDIIFRVLVRHFAVLGFVIALVGLTYKRDKAEDWFWEVGIFSSFLAGALAPTSSYVHEYYQLPVMFFGVVFAGKVCARVLGEGAKKWQRLALSVAIALTLITGSVIYAIDYMQAEDPLQSETFLLSVLVDKYTGPDAKVLTTTGGDPTLLYLSHRKGWMISPEEVTPERLEAAVGDGADYLVGSYKVVQSYAEFSDESQKENIRDLLEEGPFPLVNSDRFFIAGLEN